MKAKLIKKLQILIHLQDLEEVKEDMHSNYGVASSRDMTEQQLIHLINVIERGVPQLMVKAEDDNRKQWISRCLVVITSRGWMGFPNGAWDEINELVKSKKIGDGKPLNQMSEEELKTAYKRLVAAHTKGFIYKNQKNFLKQIITHHSVYININKEEITN